MVPSLVNPRAEVRRPWNFSYSSELQSTTRKWKNLTRGHSNWVTKSNITRVVKAEIALHWVSACEKNLGHGDQFVVTLSSSVQLEVGETQEVPLPFLLRIPAHQLESVLHTDLGIATPCVSPSPNEPVTSCLHNSPRFLLDQGPVFVTLVWVQLGKS